MKYAHTKMLTQRCEKVGGYLAVNLSTSSQNQEEL